MTLTLGELCAGYGGLGMAVEEVFGATTAWFSEFDEAPSKILAHHWPDVPNYGDMTKIDWASIEPVDIISGGTPCQDLSAAGRRAGMNEGTRSNLWVQMREAIATQRPRYVVWENVRGAYSAGASSSVEQCPGCLGDTGDGRVFLRALGRVLGDLSDLGYDCQWRGLRAADVGACHSRYRVFVLAVDSGRVRGREGDVSAGLSATSLDRPALPDESDQGRVRPELAIASDSLRGGSRGWPVVTGHGSLPGADSAADRADHRPSESWPVASAGAVANPDCGDDDGRLGEPKRCALDGTPTPRCGQVTRSDIFAGRWCACEPPTDSESERRGEGRAEPEGLEGRPDVTLGSHTNWGEYEPAIRRWEARLGRPAPRPTEPTGRNNGHRLSPAFTEWMMGLPDGWVTDPAIGISRNEQLKACGNGVVPQQAMAALRDMLAAFELHAQVAETLMAS